MGAPLVSVIMSTFNAGRYLAEALQSLAQQTFRAFEVLVVDDGSSDQTVPILKEWVRRDSRFKLIAVNKRNLGLAANLNEMLQVSSAPYIARMDADDVAARCRLDRQLRYLQEHEDTVVVGSWAYEINDQGDILRLRKVPTSPGEIRRILPLANPMIHPSVMFRRTEILRLGGYEPALRSVQDYDLWFRCVGAGFSLANIAEPLVLYRLGNDHIRKRGLQYRLQDAKVRWRGLESLGYGLGYRIAYAAIPIILGSMPDKLKMVARRYADILDPRQRVRETK